MSEPITLRLPIPISVNAAYANRKGPGRGRVATKALRSWKASAGKSVMASLAGIGSRPVFAGRVDVLLRVPVPANGARRDGDNCLKATLDLLKTMGVIADDSWRYVRTSAVEWVDEDLGGECEVRLTEIAGAPAEPVSGARTAAKRPSEVARHPSGASAVLSEPRKPRKAATGAAALARKLQAMGFRVTPEQVHPQGTARMASETVVEPRRTAEAFGVDKRGPEI